MTRPPTAPEPLLLETFPQGSEYFLAGMELPEFVFQAQVNQAFATLDMIAQATFDNVTLGAYTDIVVGMTVWFGSAEGAWDLGWARARKAATSSVLYFSEQSDLLLDDDVFITVVAEYKPAPRHVKFLNEVPQMDYDVAYDDQHENLEPTPIMGSDAVVYLDNSGERVVNGGFGSNVTGWSKDPSTVILSAVGGCLHINRNNAAAGDHAYQVVSLIKNRMYRLVVDVDAVSDGYEIRVDGVVKFSSGTGSKTYDFTTTSPTVTIAFRVTGSATGTLDIASVSILQIGQVTFDGSDAYVVDGSGITGHVWTIDGDGEVTGGTTATPTFIVLTGRTYNIQDTLTADNGAVSVGHRRIYVYDHNRLPVRVTAETPQANYESGFWSTRLTLNTAMPCSTILDGTPLILFTRDNYGGQSVSVGPLAGRENIEMVGWLNEESIRWSAKGGSVSFNIQGLPYWLQKMQGFPPGVEIRGELAADWTNIADLTVDIALWHLLHWRSNIDTLVDVYLTEDTRLSQGFQPAAGNIWGQINEIAKDSILAAPGCNRYGQIYVEIDPQLVPVVDRTWPEVMEVVTEAWFDAASISQSKDTHISQQLLSGVVITSRSNGLSLYSLSPGHLPEIQGPPDVKGNLLASSQTQFNMLTGLIMGQRNNPYPQLEFEFGANNRFIDLWPRQYCTLVILDTDTLREIEFDGRLIPRRIQRPMSKAGAISTLVVFEAESFPKTAINGDIPVNETEIIDIPSTPPDGGGGNIKMPPLPLLPIPGGLPLLVGEAPARVLTHDVNKGLMWTRNFNELDYTKIIWKQMNWGLTDVVYKAIAYMILLPSEEVYITDGKNIYYAPTPDQPYKLVLSESTMAGGGTLNRMYGMSLNKNSGEIFVGVEYPGCYNDCYIGTHSGFSKVVLDISVPCYSVSDYGAGWVVGAATGGHGYGVLYNNAGVRQTTLDLGGGGPPGSFRRLGSSPTILFTFGSDLYITTNNFTTATKVLTWPVGTVSWDVDITGQYLIESATDNKLYKSTDGGSSWSAALSKPASSIQLSGNQFCVDADRWVVVGKASSAAYTPIIYTPDDGTNWEYKHGNLSALFPSTVLSWDLVQVLP